MELLQEHATTIALETDQGWCGVMLRGPSASGKSDLALRMMDQGARLVADDRTCLNLVEGNLVASPPTPIAGKLEVRGLGIVKVGYLEQVPLSLVVDLKPLDQLERLPDQKNVTYLGQDLPLIQLCAFETSATVKLKYALNAERVED